MHSRIGLILAVLLVAGCGDGDKAESEPKADTGVEADQPNDTDDETEDDTGDAPSGEDIVGHPTFMSPHASPIAFHEGRVFVVNTPADTLDVIDAESLQVTGRIHVGVDPVSVAVRPDGKEIWVSNHVSDSVSVIDFDPTSLTHMQVVATIQDFDDATKSTRFDEPMAVVFAGNDKAYVALSSQNEVAVIDVATRSISKKLVITAQDPRAMAVRNGRLYVISFESGNTTQVSGCMGELDGD